MTKVSVNPKWVNKSKTVVQVTPQIFKRFVKEVPASGPASNVRGKFYNSFYNDNDGLAVGLNAGKAYLILSEYSETLAVPVQGNAAKNIEDLVNIVC